MKYFSAESSGISINPKVDDYSRNSPVAFSEQVTTVINFFEGWNHCERTVVLYALLKRLRYHNIKFLQHAIDHVLTQRLNSENNLSSVLIDLNANNPSYLKKLLNAYKTLHMNDAADTLSSVSSDKESMQSYGSDFQITNCDEQKLYDKKKELLIEVLNMLPLLKPGNDEAKLVYLALIPATVRDTMQNRVPTELVQQIFSYLLIHPAISSEDRRSLNVWLRHLEDYMHSNDKLTDPKMANNNSNLSQSIGVGSDASVSSVSSLTSTSSMSNNSMSSGNSAPGVGTKPQQKQRNVDWQTIAPPSKQYNPPPPNALPKLNPLPDWTNFIPKDTTFSNSGIKNIAEVSLNSSGSSCNRRNSSITDQHCDNFNGINLNELGSSQNKLGLSLSIAKIGDTHTEESSLVNGVAAVAGTSSGSNSQIDSNSYNSNSNNSSSSNEEHDTSFSKNGTEIIDFEPQIRISVDAGCTNESSAPSVNSEQNQKPSFPTMLMSNYEQTDMARWSLDSKLASLKTRRSNSLTTQAISTPSTSSNSSVITVNDNCSNSNENLAQFANKPRSFSFSIEHQRGVLANSGSDTRLDELKPNYIKFQTRNVGMSNIGLWLKSLRLHKYIDLFKDMTYEDMLCITEEYLQGLGVTKGASHKLALCIEKLKDRSNQLSKLEEDLLNGHTQIQSVVEILTNMVLTPMKPVDAVGSDTNENNVALKFLKVVDLVGSAVQRDSCMPQDEENIGMLMWVLDRSIHNEAFVNHSSQLKELKFKLSKLKISIGHKAHHVKNGSAGNLNKSRWAVKNRKCDMKNGSNDRINHRKNSNDTLSFPTGGVSQNQQQHHHSNHTHPGDYDKFSHMMNNGSNNGGSQQYKSSSYPNFINNQQQQGKHQHHNIIQLPQQQQQQQQQQLQPNIITQHSPFAPLPIHQQQQQHPQHQQHHRRSLNNLIMVSGGPQQPQKMIFKPGQGIVPAGPSSLENQMRRTSLTTTTTTINIGNLGGKPETTQQPQSVAAQSPHQQHQQQQPPQQQQTNNPMSGVVMVSSEELGVGGGGGGGGAAIGPQQQAQQQQTHLLNNNSSMLNNNLLCQQQQQELQLLAAAAAAVGNSCRSTSNLLSCLCNVNANSSNNCSKNTCCGVSNVNGCNNLPIPYNETVSGNHAIATLAHTAPTQPILTSINIQPKDKLHTKSLTSNSSTTTTTTTVAMNDINSLDQLETLCLQMTEQAIN